MKKLSAAIAAGILGMLLAPGAANAYIVYSGTITLTLNISIASSIPTTTPIQCAFNTQIANQTDSAQESVGVAGTRSGSTATCILHIPYTWHLYNGPSDTVELSYSITADNGTGIRRTTSNTLGSIKVPATGANLSFTAVARI